MTDTRTHRVMPSLNSTAPSEGRPLDVIYGAGGDGQPMPLVGHAPEPEHRSGWAIAVAAVAVGIIVLPLLAVGLNWLMAEGLAVWWRMGG